MGVQSGILNGSVRTTVRKAGTPSDCEKDKIPTKSRSFMDEEGEFVAITCRVCSQESRIPKGFEGYVRCAMCNVKIRQRDERDGFSDIIAGLSLLSLYFILLAIPYVLGAVGIVIGETDDSLISQEEPENEDETFSLDLAILQILALKIIHIIIAIKGVTKIAVGVRKIEPSTLY
jgi:hypothetical protein